MNLSTEIHSLGRYGIYLIRSCRGGGWFIVYEIANELISDDCRPSMTLIIDLNEN